MKIREARTRIPSREQPPAKAALVKFERSELALLLAILLIGSLLRLNGIADPFMGPQSFNEAHYSLVALNFFKYGPLVQMDELGRDFSTTPLLPWMIFASFNLLGVSELAARLPVFICGVLSLLVFYLLARELTEKRTALLATALAAAAPGIIYISRSVQLESPATLFLLLALLLMARRSAWAAMLMLAVAMAFKSSMLLGLPALLLLACERRAINFRKKEAAALLLVPFIPAALWYSYGFLSGGGGSVGWYFGRFDGGIAAAAQSALLALFSIPLQLGAATFVLALAGAFRYVYPRMRQPSGILLLWALAWYLIILAYPSLYSGNPYYDYPGWYSLCVFAAIPLAELYGMASQLAGKAAAAGAIALVLSAVLLLNIYQYDAAYSTGWPFPEQFPFQSAKLVKEMNVRHEPVVVDVPQTFFYAGGDPEYIHWEWSEAGIAEEAAAQNCTYAVTYLYCNSTRLNAQLAAAGYVRIAPCAWKRA